MKKYFYIFIIIKKNLKVYGYTNILKLISFEIFYNFFKFDFKTNFFDDSKTSGYEETKINKNYNTPYSPTPYYFLHYLKIFFKKKNIKKYKFIDFGCGAGRVLFFFEKFFTKLIGIDINSEYKKYFLKKKILFKCLNLRNKKSLKFIAKIKSPKIFFFYEPFEIFLVLKHINFLKKNDYLVLINQKIKDLRFVKVFEITMRKKNMTIYIKN